jgi:flagellar hook-basal body complex protein FliE
MSNTIGSGFPASFPGTMPTRPTAPTGAEGEEGGFGATLRNAVDRVGELSDVSDKEVGELVQGERQDIHSVMIAVEKADIAFQLMMQVRNKILNAYQEVSKMQF